MRRPNTLLLPDDLKPSKACATANRVYADAIEQRIAAAQRVREARAKTLEARRQDAAPAIRGELERAKQEAEHGHREAERQEERALREQVAAISSEASTLVRQVNAAERAESAVALLDRFAVELDALENDVGTIATIATVGSERTRVRGFEPVRSQADRFNTPAAHLAGLRKWVTELRERAERQARTVEPDRVAVP